MAHNIVFEDGRKSQELETNLIALCELADESATAFGFSGASPEGVRGELEEAYSEYAMLMGRYDKAIPTRVQSRYDEVLDLIK